MKISMDWISDFVDLPAGLSDRELAEKITMGVCEVEGFERNTVDLKAIRVAEVRAVEAHPNSDRLQLATVDTGGGTTAVVVCGAPNCRPGIKVPYASIGTRLAGGFVLESKEIRGIVSQGMLCAEDELGLSDNHAGLMELEQDAPIGASMEDILDGSAANALLLDIDNKSLTHRPDCWGHYGLAREFALVFEQPFKESFNEQWKNKLKEQIRQDGGTAPVRLHVEKDSSNRGFIGLSMDGIVVGSSPLWMQSRLKAAGMRPINTVVDISNYVMLETGIPNHIFDRQMIQGGTIIVRRAGDRKEFTTLDEHKRILMPIDTMVCDKKQELAIAGIMGGMESSVTDNTTTIMIECANWLDVEIRQISNRLGLRTDASMRYEKSLDSQQLEICLLRIYELFTMLTPGAGAVGGIQLANMDEAVKLAIKTSPQRISNVLGYQVNEKRFTDILEALGFGVERISPGGEEDNAAERTHLVHVPTWRSTKDIECEADIVEEIGRIIGYDNIMAESPKHAIEALRLSPAKVLFRKAQDFMVLRGRALEIMTYPLVGEALLNKAEWPVLNENLVLKNALTPEHDRMRPSLIPSLLLAVAENRKEHEEFRIFECGRAYEELEKDEFSRDLHQIGIAFQSQETTPFMELVDVIEEMLSYISLPGKLVNASTGSTHSLLPASWEGSHPHEVLDVLIMGQSRGVIFSLHPQVAKRFKIKGRTALAVLDFSDVMNRKVKNIQAFHPLDRFPGAEFDLTVILEENDYAADAVSVVNKLKIKGIRSVGVHRVFSRDDNLRALTLKIRFRDEKKTLDANFLKESEERIIHALEKAGYPLKS